MSSRTIQSPVPLETKRGNKSIFINLERTFCISYSISHRESVEVREYTRGKVVGINGGE